MSRIVISPRVWPTVVTEALNYWLRKHRLMILGLATAMLISGIIALTESSDDGLISLALTGGYAPVVAGLMAMSGIVADERASGLIMMWLQKPGTLVRAYLLRYALFQALIAALAAGLAILIGVAAVAAQLLTIERALRLPIAAIPMAMIPAAIVFACSSWGIRRDAIGAVAIIVVSFTLCLRGMTDSPLSQFIRIVCYPLDSLGALLGHPAYDTGLTRPLLIVTGHLIAWTLIGVLGLRFTEHALQRGG